MSMCYKSNHLFHTWGSDFSFSVAKNDYLVISELVKYFLI